MTVIQSDSCMAWPPMHAAAVPSPLAQPHRGPCTEFSPDPVVADSLVHCGSVCARHPALQSQTGKHGASHCWGGAATLRRFPPHRPSGPEGAQLSAVSMGSTRCTPPLPSLTAPPAAAARSLQMARAALTLALAACLAACASGERKDVGSLAAVSLCHGINACLPGPHKSASLVAPVQRVSPALKPPVPCLHALQPLCRRSSTTPEALLSSRVSRGRLLQLAFVPVMLTDESPLGEA